LEETEIHSTLPDVVANGEGMFGIYEKWLFLKAAVTSNSTPSFG
jgi:hypothetical protein